MAEIYLLDKLKSVEQTFNELTRRLADPDTASNPDEYQKIAKSRSSLEEVVDTYETWKTTQDELVGARQILKEWISTWDRFCTSDQYIRIYENFWNSPEGCVSVVQDYAAKGSL